MPGASAMFSFRLISKEYRAVAHRMDRHRRHFIFRPLRACQTGTVCHRLTLLITFTPSLSRTPFSHSFRRSTSWNS
ncbi:protein YoaL [Intestinirhabdus alba]|uniref:protein YoaL n=1 Tax=Intestinirhabdus alba TaxID=2899544 RepID=UPI0038B2E836